MRPIVIFGADGAFSRAAHRITTDFALLTRLLIHAACGGIEGPRTCDRGSRGTTCKRTRRLAALTAHSRRVQNAALLAEMARNTRPRALTALLTWRTTETPSRARLGKGGAQRARVAERTDLATHLGGEIVPWGEAARRARDCNRCALRTLRVNTTPRTIWWAQRRWQHGTMPCNRGTCALPDCDTESGSQSSSTNKTLRFLFAGGKAEFRSARFTRDESTVAPTARWLWGRPQRPLGTHTGSPSPPIQDRAERWHPIAQIASAQLVREKSTRACLSTTSGWNHPAELGCAQQKSRCAGGHGHHQPAQVQGHVDSPRYSGRWDINFGELHCAHLQRASTRRCAVVGEV
eukprot:110875-Prymnesium_polylepis.3